MLGGHRGRADGFAIVADGNHRESEPCGFPCPPKVENGVFRGDVHDFGDSTLNFVRFDFYTPIEAFTMDISQVESDDIDVIFGGTSIRLFFEDDETQFLGIVFDAPVSSLEFGTVSFTGFTVDNVRWSSVSEPNTALLLSLGLVGMATKRRRLT